jgi:hypothetical protein
MPIVSGDVLYDATVWMTSGLGPWDDGGERECSNVHMALILTGIVRNDGVSSAVV